MADVTIRPEADADVPATRAVVAAAFDKQPVVPDLVDALRVSTAWRPGLSLVAEADDRVVGHVLATRGWLDAPAALVEVLYLSPLSVAPRVQGQGIGGALVRALLAIVAERDEPAIFLEGSPVYYSRFGFEPTEPLGILRASPRIPEPASQVVRLPGWHDGLTGMLVYPDPFWVYDCVGLR